MRMAFFKEPMQPTESELRTWADSDALEPVEDFDILIWDSEDLADSFLDLAREGSCRSNRYFLHLLYGRVGTAVRAQSVDQSVDRLIAEAEQSDDLGVRKFAERARSLIADPETFEYEAWCNGQLAGLGSRKDL